MSSKHNNSLLVLALLTIDGLHFVFARALHDHLHPVTSAVYVLGTATLMMALFAANQRRFQLETFRRHFWFFLAIGGLVAIGTTINYTVVEYVDPGVASLLAQTSILFGVGFGVLWLRERLTRLQGIGAAVAIVGVGIITFQPGDFLRLGSVLVIGSAGFYAFHSAIVKRYGGDIEFVEFFLWRLVTTTGFLFLSAAYQGLLVLPTEPVAIGLLALTAIVDVMISRTLYYLSLRRLSISILSLTLTLSPLVAILWSLILFQTWPTPQGLLGGAAVLMGVGIVTAKRS